MLKKTVSYENADGVLVSKDVYFNISGNELVQKEADSGQTYSEKLKEIAASNQLQEVYPAILDMMGLGYGVRTEDGDFEKDPTGEAWKKFQNTLAFQSLMDDLLMKDPANNGSSMADFINGMLPAGMVAQAAEKNAMPGFRPGANTERPTPPVAGQQPVAATPVSAPVVSEPAPAAPQPVQSAPAEPVVSEPAPVDYSTTADPSVIVQTSEPRDPAQDFVNGGTTQQLNPDGTAG